MGFALHRKQLRKNLGNVNVIKTALSVTPNNFDSIPTQEAVCGVLYALLKDSACLNIEWTTAIIYAVTTSMKQNSCFEVQEAGLFVLAAISTHGLETKLSLCGHLDLFVRAMRDFPNAIYLQAEVRKTLKMLVKYTGSAAANIAQLDGVRALTNTMSKSPDDTILRLDVIDIILSIIIQGENSRCTKCDAIQMMLGAMIANPDCKQTQIAALSALLSLCSRDKDAQSDASSWNATSVALQCMKNHASVKDTCGNACGLLWTLALDSQRRSNILTSGGITTTLSVMKTHLSSRSLQRKACGLLTALTCDGKGRLEARAGGGASTFLWM
jgi:hypothetical protein